HISLPNRNSRSANSSNTGREPHGHANARFLASSGCGPSPFTFLRTFMGWFSARKHRNRNRSTPSQRAARKSTSRVGRFESLEAGEVFSVTFHGGALLQNVEAQGVYLGS